MTCSRFRAACSEKKTFLAGVLFAVINLLGGIASAVLYALNLIPLVGFIAALVADLFVGAFLSLAAVRMMLSPARSARRSSCPSCARSTRRAWGRCSPQRAFPTSSWAWRSSWS